MLAIKTFNTQITPGDSYETKVLHISVFSHMLKLYNMS